MLPKVFLIDDDPVSSYILVDLVESIDLPFAVFKDAESFLRQDLYELAGCIVTDVRMPGMNGLELQDELRHLEIGVPIIFISAYPEVPTVVRAMRGGAIDFFAKPFSTQQLLDRIQDGLRIDQPRAEIQARNREMAERMALLTGRRVAGAHMLRRLGRVVVGPMALDAREPGARGCVMVVGRLVAAGRPQHRDEAEQDDPPGCSPRFRT